MKKINYWFVEKVLKLKKKYLKLENWRFTSQYDIISKIENQIFIYFYEEKDYNNSLIKYNNELSFSSNESFISNILNDRKFSNLIIIYNKKIYSIPNFEVILENYDRNNVRIKSIDKEFTTPIDSTLEEKYSIVKPNYQNGSPFIEENILLGQLENYCLIKYLRDKTKDKFNSETSKNLREFNGWLNRKK